MDRKPASSLPRSRTYAAPGLKNSTNKDQLRKKSPGLTPRARETPQSFLLKEENRRQASPGPHSPKNKDQGEEQNAETKFAERSSVDIRFDLMTQKGYGPDKSSDINQDALLAVEVPGKNIKVFSVFDGHGPGGHLVSNFLKTEFSAHLEECLLSSKLNFPTALKSTFETLNQSLLLSPIDSSLSGSTGNTIAIRGKSLFCANTGDSRAVLGSLKNGKWTAKPLSVDHKPALQRERERITKAGGKVSKESKIVKAIKYLIITSPLPSKESSGPLRVWHGNSGLPGLAMTRSFGDQIGMKAGITCEPEVTEYLIESDDKFVILATDGFWEFISNSTAVGLVSSYYERAQLDKVCLRLINEASFCWHSVENLKRKQ